MWYNYNITFYYFCKNNLKPSYIIYPLKGGRFPHEKNGHKMLQNKNSNDCNNENPKKTSSKSKNKNTQTAKSK